MGKYEFEIVLKNAKGEGAIAGIATKRMEKLVELERREEHLETGMLPDTAGQAIKIRGNQPGWTVQESLIEDPEERLRFRRPIRKDSSKTP